MAQNMRMQSLFSSLPVPPPSDPPHRDLTRPALWQQAEAEQAPALARAAAALGALDSAIEDAPWLLPRLALIEIEAMLAAQGITQNSEDIGRDLLAAWGGADAEGLMQARWAMRRLAPEQAVDEAPLKRPVPRDLRNFLGLHRVEVSGLAEDQVQRPAGDDFDAASSGFLKALDRISGRHPLTRAAAALPFWRLSGLSPVEDVIEGASFAALVAVQDLPFLGFAPLGRHGRTIWRLGGPPSERLAHTLEAFRAGASDARAELRRLRHWRAESLRAVARMKGETPARMIEAALLRPLVGTEDIERALGISRDSAERGLARLQEMGILREITGRGRFRLWTAGR